MGHFPRSFGRFEVSPLWSGVSPSLSLDINLGVCLVWLAIFLEAWRLGFPSTNTLMSGTGNLPELRMKRGANLTPPLHHSIRPPSTMGDPSEFLRQTTHLSVVGVELQ